MTSQIFYKDKNKSYKNVITSIKIKNRKQENENERKTIITPIQIKFVKLDISCLLHIKFNEFIITSIAIKTNSQIYE